jgi:AsmA-like C-terminal region
MFKSRPLLLLVLTLCLLFVALVSFWLAALPQRLLAGLKQNLVAQHEMELVGDKPSLSFSNGIELSFENVSLQGNAENSFTISAQAMRVKGNSSALFGAVLSANDVVLQNAVVDIDVSKGTTINFLKSGNIKLENCALRLRDSNHKGVIAIGDLNGNIQNTADGATKTSLTFLLGGMLTTFNAEIESTERLAKDGSPADILLATKNMLVAFSGRAKLQKGFELSGQNTIEADNADALFRWLGMPIALLDDAGKFTLQSGMSVEGLSVAFEKLSAKLGASGITGNVRVTTGADRMKLAGEIGVSRIALFGSKPERGILSTSWSEKALPLANVVGTEFDLAVKAQQIVAHGVDVGAAAFNVKTDGQRTTITLPRQAFAGGEADAKIELSQQTGAATLKSTFDTKGTDAKLMLGGLLGFSPLEGSVDLSAKLGAEGASPAVLVSTLAGTFRLETVEAKLNGIDVPTLLLTPDEGWKSAPTLSTPTVALSLTTQIREGVMSVENSELRTPSFSLKPKGEIDVLRQVFDLSLTPKGKGLDPRVSLTGPWVKPKFSTTIVLKEKKPITPPAN